MMYICEDCGKIFDEEEVVVIHDDPSPAGVSLPSGYYTYRCCPYCDSEDISEATECEVCGKMMSVNSGEENICDECIDDISKELEEIREGVGLSYMSFKGLLDRLY